MLAGADRQCAGAQRQPGRRLDAVPRKRLVEQALSHRPRRAQRHSEPRHGAARLPRRDLAAGGASRLLRPLRQRRRRLPLPRRPRLRVRGDEHRRQALSLLPLQPRRHRRGRRRREIGVARVRRRRPHRGDDGRDRLRPRGRPARREARAVQRRGGAVQRLLRGGGHRPKRRLRLGRLRAPSRP